MADDPRPPAPEQPAAPPEKPAAPEPEKKPFRWTPLKLIIAGSIVLVVIIFATTSLIYAMGHETTDDAYTQAHVHEISSRITGTVTEVLVLDNQLIHAGQVLVKLDPRDYQVKVDQARANFEKAKADYDRVAALKGDIAISAQDYDQSRATLDVDKALLDDAVNQLSYCTITAPTDGIIGHKTVEVGNRVNVGASLMTIVEDGWVVANFKETQLRRMKPGQRVKIVVDAFADHPFYGWIDSFSPGSGATFALLPPDNATGNFTKIVQRVPVKIFFDEESVRDYESRLVPGLSVEAAVDLHSLPRDVRVRANDQIERDAQSHLRHQDQPGPP